MYLQVRRHIAKLWHRLGHLETELQDHDDRIGAVELAVLDRSAHVEHQLRQAQYATAVLSARVAAGAKVMSGELG